MNAYFCITYFFPEQRRSRSNFNDDGIDMETYLAIELNMFLKQLLKCFPLQSHILVQSPLMFDNLNLSSTIITRVTNVKY